MNLEAITADLQRAHASMNVVQEAIAEFQAACIMKDEPASKIARDKALGALDGFMDHIAAANMVSWRA